jgi:hypothetical protein
MDYMITRACRTTHLKIVVVALVAAIAVVAVGINARVGDMTTARGPAAGTVVKAGQPAAYAVEHSSAIR